VFQMKEYSQDFFERSIDLAHLSLQSQEGNKKSQ
jgi:hypothetical protein